MIIRKSNDDDRDESVIGGMGGSSLMLKPISAPNQISKSLNLDKIP